MTDAAKTIDQLEATISAVTYAYSALNQETKRDIEGLFVTLRQQLDIHDGLEDGSPLRPEKQVILDTTQPKDDTNTKDKKTKG